LEQDATAAGRELGVESVLEGHIYIVRTRPGRTASMSDVSPTPADAHAGSMRIVRARSSTAICER
jgi:hypothetical protein